MTAKQYMRRKVFIGFLTIFTSLGLAFIAAIISSRVQHISLLEKTPSNSSFFWIMFSMISVWMITTICFYFLQRHFMKNHPEMAFIDAWVAHGHSLESYPTNPAEKDQLASECLERLKDLAIFVNETIYCRDMVSKVRQESRAAIQQIGKLQRILTTEAESQEKIYLQYWDLVVSGVYVKNKALEIVSLPLLQPHDFRQRLNAQRGDILG